MTLSQKDLMKIFEVIVAFNSERDYLKLLGTILDKMMDMTNADAGTLYIRDEEALHFRIVRNKTLNIRQSAAETAGLPPVKLDKRPIENICAYGAVHNEIIAVDDVYHSDRFNFNGPKQYDQMTGYRTGSVLVLPLTATFNTSEEVIGVIQLINAIDPATGQVVPFGDIDNPPVLPSLSRIAANILANLFYAKEIKDLLNSFVAVMTQAIDERSPYNRNHTQHVSEYCAAFARFLSNRFPPGHALYFDEIRIDRLVMAAYLHDIGKIITPLYVMDKPDRLGGRMEALQYRFAMKQLQVENAFLSHKINDDEHERQLHTLSDALALIDKINTAPFLTDEMVSSVQSLSDISFVNTDRTTEALLTASDLEALSVRKGTLTTGERLVMQEHASLTGRLLDKMAFSRNYREVPSWARGHHEMLDGTGYPEGLTGDAIALETCILTMMDIYDALTASDRPYKAAMPVTRALGVLTSMAEEGKLHPMLVNLFVESHLWEAGHASQET